MRIFVDANVLVSAIVSEGNERGLLELAEAGKVQLFLSTYD